MIGLENAKPSDIFRRDRDDDFEEETTVTKNSPQTLTNKTLTSPTITGTPVGLAKAHVGLGNVTNESKSTMFASPTFTGTVSGVTATHVGLGNVTNESKSTMFASPTFTGTVSATNVSATTFSGDCTGNAATASKIDGIANNDIVQKDISQALTNKTINGCYLETPTGNFGTVQTPIGSTAHADWGGYNVDGKFVFMGSATAAGIYNDIDNKWMVRCESGGEALLHHAGTGVIRTTSDGGTIGSTSGSASQFESVTGNYGSVQTSRAKAGHSGYSIAGKYVFMANPSATSGCGIYDDDNNRWWMYFSSTANAVGIGKTNPSKKLDVEGAIRGTNVYAGSTQLSSDDRAKHNEVDISNGLTTVNKLKSIFYIKTSITDACGNEYSRNHNFTSNDLSNGLPEGAQYESGYIAQDISNIAELSHLVDGSEYDASGNSTALSLNYIGIQPYITKAIQELHALVLQQSQLISQQGQQIIDLSNQVAALS